MKSAFSRCWCRESEANWGKSGGDVVNERQIARENFAKSDVSCIGGVGIAREREAAV